MERLLIEVVEHGKLRDVNHVEEGASETFRHDDDCLDGISRIGRHRRKRVVGMISRAGLRGQFEGCDDGSEC